MQWTSTYDTEESSSWATTLYLKGIAHQNSVCTSFSPVPSPSPAFQAAGGWLHRSLASLLSMGLCPVETQQEPTRKEESLAISCSSLPVSHCLRIVTSAFFTSVLRPSHTPGLTSSSFYLQAKNGNSLPLLLVLRSSSNMLVPLLPRTPL